MIKRILVIEDQEDNRQILRDLLTSADFEVISIGPRSAHNQTLGGEGGWGRANPSVVAVNRTEAPSRSTIIANDVFPQACIGPRSTFLALILISIKDASFAPRQR
jgi:CheY-like chemotaxis protein